MLNIIYGMINKNIYYFAFFAVLGTKRTHNWEIYNYLYNLHSLLKQLVTKRRDNSEICDIDLPIYFTTNK